MKKIYLLLIIPFFILGCEKDLNKSRENDSFPFGNIRRDMAAKKVVNEEGNVSYTMVLETVEKEFPKVNLLFILTILSFMKKTKEKT